MSDPRITPDPALMEQAMPATVGWEFADLCRAPYGPRERQLIFGDTVICHASQRGADNSEWTYVQSDKDGYCGFVELMDLGAPRAIEPTPEGKSATHQVIVRQTQCYEEPDFKSWDLGNRSFGSKIVVTGESERFVETPEGHIPKPHVAPISNIFTEPAQVADIFLGTPYLWGGNTCWGIDCSGLVQAALLACGIPCPGDSDMQMALGTDATGPFRRNDLLFWKGHVALVYDEETLIHANAHAMACVYEPITKAINRIAEQGDGPVTAHRRL